MNIKLFIVDDHPMIISGLQNILSNYTHIILGKTYTNGKDLLEGLKHEQPDVLLLDIQLPDKNGDELVPIILKSYPDLRILILTNLDSILYVHNVMQRGALGYVLKTTDQKTLVDAIEKVYSGNEFLEPAVREKLQEFNLRMKKDSFLKPTLTPREKEILQLIVNGCTGQEISQRLHIGFRTVEHYRFNILVKMGVNNTALLVKKALKLGLVD